MADVKEWGITASDNNTTSPDGAQSGWLGADVGPWARETMAAVARMNADPAWRNFAEYGLSPTGTKSIARSGSAQIQITATGTWAASTTETFANGRLIRFQRSTGEWVYGFITGASIATTVLTVDLALMGDSAIDGAWTFTNNELEFFVAMDTIDSDRAIQPLGGMAFGGAGTTTERNTKFPSVLDIPEGVLWANTTDDLLQVVVGTAGARAWLNVAPLMSAWSSAGAQLLLQSVSTQAKLTVDAFTGFNPAVALHVNGTQQALLAYLDAAGQTVLEGGDTTATAGRIYIKDSDGKAYFRNYVGGVAGDELSLTPGESFAFPGTILRMRTGAGANVTVPQAGTYVEAVSGTLPADVQALLESSDWDELKIDLLGVITSYFISTPSSGAVYTFNLFLGSGYDTTPPVDLTSGYTKQFRYTHSGEDPFEGEIDTTETGDFAGRLLNADISGTIDSFYISVGVGSVGNDQDFTWTANNGNRYSSITFRDVVRVVT